MYDRGIFNPRNPRGGISKKIHLATKCILKLLKKIEKSVTDYLKAKSLPYLFIWLKTENFLEYFLGNLIDRPPKQNKKETEEMYLERITPRQAVRISRYNYNKWFYNNAYYHIKAPDFSMWENKSRKTLEKLLETIFMVEDKWEEHYKSALRRKMMEK